MNGENEMPENNTPSVEVDEAPQEIPQDAPPEDAPQQEAPQEGGDEAKADPPPFSLDLGRFSEGMPPEELEFFGRLARESGATADVASQLMQRLGTYNQAVQDFTSKEWAEASRNDSEFGGAHFEQNIGTAKQALERFGSPELVQLLGQSPMGNHPEVIRFLVKVGKAMSEDTFVNGAAATGGDFDPRSFFEKSNMNP